MSTQAELAGDTAGAKIARRHEQDVAAILDDLRNPQTILEHVIESAFSIAVDRGDTTEANHADFVAWSQRVITSARSEQDPTVNGRWSQTLRSLLLQYLAIAGRASEATVSDRIDDANLQLAETLTLEEEEIAELVAGVLVGSTLMWSPGGSNAKKDNNIDGSQVVRADVTGAISGAAGAAIATFWTGPASGAAVAVSTAAGAVLGSATDAVLQDAADDAVEQAGPEPG